MEKELRLISRFWIVLVGLIVPGCVCRLDNLCVCIWVCIYLGMYVFVYMLLSQKLLRFVRYHTVAFEAGLST